MGKNPESDLATEYIMKQGNIVGQLAKKLYPDGIDMPEEPDKFKLNIEEPKEALKQRKIIFEAGIIAGQTYAKADIMIPVGEDEWDGIDVKASTREKK